MDTPGQTSSHTSSSLPSQSNHKLEDEVCEDETDDNVPSRMREMIAMENHSHESHGLSTVLTEIQEEFLQDIQHNVSGLFPEFSFVMSCVSNDGAQLPVLMITPLQVFIHPPLGIMPRIQVSVNYKVYRVHVLMRLWKRETFETVEDITFLCKIIGEKSQY